tara:strand:- start:2814 stop:3635 length:822 start_codon:yes stop_codon:yes gene_type:complete
MRKILFQNRNTIAAFVIISLIIVASCNLFAITLSHTSFVTGTVLLICLLMLAGYQLRKKLSILLIGKTSAWLQFHIFLGLLTSVLFMLHIKMQIPDGLFEFVLFLNYLTVFFSGVAGWILSRRIPHRLLSRGEEVIFERIPLHRRNIHEKVKSLVRESNTSEKAAIPDFYEEHLRTFFEGPRNQLRHILHSERHRHELSQKITALKPFLNPQELAVLQQLTEQIQLKDDLDYQYVFQAIIKLWPFVHVPLTYSLIIFALYHTLAVCAFASTSG